MERDKKKTLLTEFKTRLGRRSVVNDEMDKLGSLEPSS